MWPERRKLVEMWHAGRAAALATLVAVEGSSYRKQGARLMVSTDGDYVGSISGGCLEAELARKARWLVRDGACVQRYSTAVEDSSDIPFGLGCGGTVHILLEPADTPEFDMLLRALDASLHGETADVYTMLPSGQRRFSRAVQAGTHAVASRPLGPEALHEHVAAPPRLLIFGAGNDSQPLVRLAALMGWRVAVVDARSQSARADRFPKAEQVFAVHPEAPLPFPVNESDLAVVMTHSFEQDRAWLQALMPKRLQFLGLLGAHHRNARLAADLAKLLAWPLQQVCDALHAPVGLDLGGDGAEAIALSIVAEMQASLSRRFSLSRRMSTATVEEQLALLGDADLYQGQCALDPLSI